MKPITKNIMMTTVGKFKLTLFSIFLTYVSFAQYGWKGGLVTDVSLGANVYQFTWNQYFEGNLAASVDANVNVGYNFHKQVSAQVELERQSLLLGDSANQNRSVGSYLYGVGLDFSAYETRKFQFSFGMKVGGNHMNVFVGDSLNIGELKGNGVYQRIYATTRFYFGDKRNLGLCIKGGFINNPVQFVDYSINGQAVNEVNTIPLDELRLNSSGFFLKVGFTYFIRLKNYF